MLDQRVVDELRQLFLDGATPSRLMQCIATRHPDDPRLHSIIMDYFKEAFHVSLLRNVVSGDEFSPAPRHAHYDRDVVPEIIQRVPEWNCRSLEDTWLDGVAVRSLAEHAVRLSGTRFEELDRVWNSLKSEEKQFIIRRIAQKDYYWDVMKSLACLAERLQQKVVELERQLAQESHCHLATDEK